MKVCNYCDRVNPDDAEVCLECEGSEFTEILIPFYDDDIESYLENK